VVAATLAAVGLQGQPGQEPLDTLVAHLQPRRLLLVLDNCEHVVAACAALAARLLGACPELRILTTSQQAMGNADETVWPVAPLALPPHSADALTPGAVQELGQYDAVQLFVERAGAVREGFVLSAATAAGVAAICRRLDGLPLAIELAAARLNVLPVAEILGRLDDRFQLLRRGRRAAIDRHQALQATMDWSYLLLDPAEQALLRRLAVFAGGWELATAEVVCAGDEVAVESILDLLDALLERSLVYVYKVDRTPRYGMLQTVRQYALQQLEHTGEAAALRDRHLRWCVALAEQAAPLLQGAEQGAWLSRLEREHDNLRAALQWALDRSLSALGLRLATGLWPFWLRRGHRHEGRHWLAIVLALPADADEATTVVRATATEGAAWLAEDNFEFARASELFVQSGALRRAVGQEERTAALLINAAMGARAGGDYARATALLEESLALNRMQGSRESTAHGGLELSIFRLALVLREQGEYARASTLCEECLALARKRADTEGVGLALLSMGDIARDQGDMARVRALCEESLALFRGLVQQWAIGFSLNNLALASYLDGDLALAASRADESEAIFRELQAAPSLAEVLITVGRIRGAQGEAAAARASLAEAITLAWAKGPRWVVAAALEGLGVQAVRQGRGQYGVPLLGAAATLRRAMGAPVRPSDRPAIEDALAAARMALGDAAYTGAWAAGESLPLEEVISLALQDTDAARRGK
jgi:non-specific serine/threonine protein kinase